MAAGERVPRGVLVLDDVAALQPAGAVHRREPADQVAGHLQDAADDDRPDLAVAQRARAQRAQEGAHLLAVVPLLLLDLADARPLVRIGEGAASARGTRSAAARSPE